jgi:superfamily II DNA or RNA helicase
MEGLKLKPDCVRRVANWSQIKPAHKFDKDTYDPKITLKDIDSKYSPKMKALLHNIETIDKHDKKEHGHTFKHFIFSDVKQGGYGAKIIAASLLASGYNLAYDEKLKLQSDAKLLKSKGKNFALLCSTGVYDNSINAVVKKTILSKYNQRPDNVKGDFIHIIVMDSGFKEGIDLFDIKYVHIFEPQTSKADQKQVIGRGTRTCGQKGLRFIPNQGWALNVFLYDVSVPEEYRYITRANSLFSSFMLNKGIDLRQLVLAEELERLYIAGSVDYELNKNIHKFKAEGHDHDIDIFKSYVGGADKDVHCDKSCGKIRPTKHVPVSLPLMIVVFLSLNVGPIPLNANREFFCSLLKSDPVYCAAVKNAYKDPTTFVRSNKKALQLAYIEGKHKNLSKSHRVLFKTFLFGIIEKPKNVDIVEEEPFYPDKPLKFLQTRQYVRDNFSQYTWPKVKVENMCGFAGGAEVMNFSPTQDFIRHYFTPKTPQKGMLLVHSVGTGKTCAAIATATSSFEKQGYTILWVTRTTLKSDIWKNMFDQVCHVDIQSKLKRGEAIPDSLEAAKKLLSKSWAIRPLSYKQFSNLVTGKNSYYQDLVKRNGAADPLKKTLVIIDEAHKLYGGEDLSSKERPDMEKFHASLMHSYNVSKEDSVRLLLMTATPITNDPFEFVKLINLLRPSSQQITTRFSTFSGHYLSTKGIFTKAGDRKFLDEIAGYVSYLNRERDLRMFAQPTITPIMVKISEKGTDVPDIDAIKQKYVGIMDNIKNEIGDARQEVEDAKQEIKDIKQKCKGLRGENREECLEEEGLKEAEDALKEAKDALIEAKRAIKPNIKKAQQDRAKEIRHALNDPSQVNTLETKCVVKPKRAKRDVANINVV